MEEDMGVRVYNFIIIFYLLYIRQIYNQIMIIMIMYHANKAGQVDFEHTPANWTPREGPTVVPPVGGTHASALSCSGITVWAGRCLLCSIL